MLRPLLAATALAAADAFAGIGPRIGVSPPAGLSAPLHAAGGPEGRGDGPAKSMFENVLQNLQLPWDDPPKAPPLKSRMAELLGEKGVEPPRKKKPRTPRHPSALHELHQGDTSHGDESEDINGRVAKGTSEEDINIHGSKAGVDEYVRSAEEAVQSVRANGDKPDDRREMSTDESDAAEDIFSKRIEKNVKPRRPKLGILLVDHGSKREASNAHLESVAESYQSSFDALPGKNEIGEAHAKANAKVTVRAAHMEIAQPSILSTLRRLIVDDQVTRVVCVPYFLSPGKHATIDVPNLIAEAIDVLDSEGLLDYTRWNDDSEGDGRKERRIEIASSAALGTNVDRMLGVVDGLVRKKLEEDGGSATFQLGPRGGSNINGGSSAGDEHGGSLQQETEKELRKYANRAALLENMLEEKTKQLKTVTNRATLMEDALGRLQDKMQREREERAKQRDEEGTRWEAAAANATSALEAMGGEKAALEEQMAALERQLADAERGYNATLVDMEADLAATEREVQRLRDELDAARRQTAEQSEDDGEELRQEMEGRQRRIDELQRQLEELLDAHAELEELQDETEASVGRYRERLQEAEANHTEAMEVERREMEGYRSQWLGAQQQLEAAANRTQAMLGESAERYEALLEEERGEKWRGQCEALEEELASVRNVTLPANNATITDAAARAEEEWSNLREEVSNAKAANASAAERAQRLELQLQRQEEDHEASTAKKEEQQEQLQKYLRAQLSTYYDTIQGQTSQIDELQSQMDAMQQRHNDSMLIATNSVEASLRREEELLTSVEELEAALVGAGAERDRGSLRLAEAQLRLDALEGAVAAVQSSEEEASSSRADLEQRNEDLLGELERLRGEVQRASEEKEREAMAGESGEEPQGQRRRWLRRAILRPWTLFRRQEADQGR